MSRNPNVSWIKTAQKTAGMRKVLILEAEQSGCRRLAGCSVFKVRCMAPHRSGLALKSGALGHRGSCKDPMHKCGAFQRKASKNERSTKSGRRSWTGRSSVAFQVWCKHRLTSFFQTDVTLSPGSSTTKEIKRRAGWARLACVGCARRLPALPNPLSKNGCFGLQGRSGIS